MRLEKTFFEQPATILAPTLIGKLICRDFCGVIEKYRITETECYFGEEDSACHASRGKTERTKIMYDSGGVLYVYLCYGLHYMLNIVSGEEGHPEAVLIRGIVGASGPGRVTKQLGIGREYNGISAISDTFWLEDDGFSAGYHRTKRIGIDYASEEDKNKLWRYINV